MNKKYREINRYEIINANTIPETGATPVHYWAAMDDVHKLIEQVNFIGRQGLILTDFLGNTILHYAANFDAVKVSKFIVDRFPNVHFQNNKKITPGHIAAQKGSVKLLKIFQKSSTLLVDDTTMKWKPLHFAIFYGQAEAVKFLLENKINSVDDLIYGTEFCSMPFGYRRLKFISPYDLSLITENKEITELLEEFGALPSLHAAVSSQKLMAVTYLVESPDSIVKGNLGMNAGPNKYTALHIAAIKGYYEICHYLIQSGASINEVDAFGLTPLEEAVLSDSLKAVIVMKNIASDKILEKSSFLAADLGREEISSELVKSCSMDFNNDGDSLLIRLIKRNLIDVAFSFLKSKKCNIGYKDSRGATALHYSAAVTSKDLLEALVSSIDINLQDNEGKTPLMYAILSGNLSSESPLINSDQNLGCNCGLTPFAIDFAFNVTGLLQPNEENISKRYNIDFRKAKDLIKEHKILEKTVKLPNQTFQCPTLNLVSSKVEEQFKTFEFFEDEKVNNVSILHLAALGKSETVSKILELNHDLLISKDSLERTPLFYAAKANNIETLDALLKETANINELDQKENTILHFLRDDSLISVAQIIYKRMTIPLTKVNKDGQNPFHAFCNYGAIKLLSYFVSCLDKNDINVLKEKDNFGKTPLDYALMNKHYECITFLHSKEVENMLNIYVNQGDLDKIKKCVESGYPVNSCDKNGMTPIHFASILGNKEILEYLINKGGNIQAVNNQGLSSLHYAAHSNNLEVIKIILKSQFNLRKIRSIDQPYLLSTYPKCREFLYHYWKRQVIIKKIFDVIKKYNQSIIDLRAFCKNKSDYWEPVINITNTILFIHENLLKKEDSGTNPYNTSSSLHHFLLLFNTFDVDPYVSKITNDFAGVIENVIRKDVPSFYKPTQLNPKNMVLAMNLIMIFYPIHWILEIASFIRELGNHLIPEIDNLPIIQSTIKRIIEQENKSQCALKSIQYLATNRINQLCGFPQIPQISAQENNCILFVSNAKIVNIMSHTRHVFQAQFSTIFKKFFGSSFFMPRIIPFNQGQIVKVILCSDFIILTEKSVDSYVVFPYSCIFANVDSKKDKSSCKLVTPAGRFELILDSELSTCSHFLLNNIISSKPKELTEINVGSSHFQKEKNKLFQCLISYLSNKDFSSTKVVIVQAGNSSECADICSNHLAETESSRIYNFIVSTKEVTDEDLIII